MIDVAALWTSDLKVGVCPQSGYYGQEQCCWLNNETYQEDSSCNAWQEWGESLNITSPTGYYVFNYFVYVSFSVIFAGLAGLFVVILAPYAAGSGIPEVRGGNEAERQ